MLIQEQVLSANHAAVVAHLRCLPVVSREGTLGALLLRDPKLEGRKRAPIVLQHLLLLAGVPFFERLDIIESALRAAILREDMVVCHHSCFLIHTDVFHLVAHGEHAGSELPTALLLQTPVNRSAQHHY